MSASGSPTQLALRRFTKNRRAMACFWIMLALGLSTLAVPLLSPHDYRTHEPPGVIRGS